MHEDQRADDVPAEKVTCFVKVGLTTRELADLAQLANSEERSVSEYIRRALRMLMYGKISCHKPGGQWSLSSVNGHGDHDGP